MAGVKMRRPVDRDMCCIYTGVMGSSSLTAKEASDALSRECLAMRLRLLGRVIAGGYDAALRPLGLTSGQLTLLAVLTKAGPMPQARLAEMLVIEKSTLSRNIRRMVEAGLVVEDDAGTPPRRVLSVSRAGRRTLSKAYPVWEGAQERAIEELGPGAGEAIKSMARPILGRSPIA